MAKFTGEIPKELLDQLNKLETGAMVEEMVEAGATVVYENIKSNMTGVFKETEELKKTLRRTKVYKTRSDDGVNAKVAFYGYFINKQGKKVPAPLVVQAREYGTSRGEAKKPFIRRSFNKKQIETAMMNVQKEYIDE